MSEVLEPLYAPIELELDVDARTARLDVPGLVELRATPITDPNSGDEFRAAFQLPNGFQLVHAEVGTGTSRVTAGIQLALDQSHAHFAKLHMNQDGVIR